MDSYDLDVIKIWTWPATNGRELADGRTTVALSIGMARETTFQNSDKEHVFQVTSWVFMAQQRTCDKFVEIYKL